MMNTKSKVAIYCRLSEEDRNKQHETDDSNSIQNQKSMLIQYVLEQGWEVYNIYSDDDYTGSDRRRPEFNKLLNDAEHRLPKAAIKQRTRFPPPHPQGRLTGHCTRAGSQEAPHAVRR